MEQRLAKDRLGVPGVFAKFLTWLKAHCRDFQPSCLICCKKESGYVVGASRRLSSFWPLPVSFGVAQRCLSKSRVRLLTRAAPASWEVASLEARPIADTGWTRAGPQQVASYDETPVRVESRRPLSETLVQHAMRDRTLRLLVIWRGRLPSSWSNLSVCQVSARRHI